MLTLEAVNQPGVAEPALPVPPLVLDTLRAVLLWHSGRPWTSEDNAAWLKLTGGTEPTTRALCDAVRAALALVGGEGLV